MLRYFSFSKLVMSKNKKGKSVPTLANATHNEPIQMDKQGNILLKIVAKPGAKQNAIIGFDEEGIGVQISAPPVEGEANIELIKFLSTTLELRKSDLSLERGSKSRQKLILIHKGTTTLDKVKLLLQKECKI